MQSNNGFELAIKQYFEEWVASLPDEYDPAIQHTFSKRYERKIRRIIALQPKPYFHLVNRTWKRVVLVAVIVLMLFGAAMSVSAIREGVIQFFVEVYEKFSTVIVMSDSGDRALDDREYVITALPDGFELHDHEQFDSYTRYEYLHPDGSRLIFRQYYSNAMQNTVDTEEVALEEVTVNGITGNYYSNKDQEFLFWHDNDYVLWLIGDLGKEALVDIAGSIVVR